MNGGCHCGEVRYRIASAPIYVNACHCRDCQKLTGSAFAINAMIEADRIVVSRGAPTMDGEGCMRCPHCQTLLWATVPMFGENILFLRAGTLDESEAVVPDAHFFVRSKHPWLTLPVGIRTFDALPKAGDPPLFTAAQQARVEAATRA